jgi:hypothetical protein
MPKMWHYFVSTFEVVLQIQFQWRKSFYHKEIGHGEPKIQSFVMLCFFFLPQGETLTLPSHQIQSKLIKKSDEEILRNFNEFYKN